VAAWPAAEALLPLVTPGTPSLCRKRADQALLVAMMDMGIPKHKAEVGGGREEGLGARLGEGCRRLALMTCRRIWVDHTHARGRTKHAASTRPACGRPCWQVALLETGNVGLEVATEWLFNSPEAAAEAPERASGERERWQQGPGEQAQALAAGPRGAGASAVTGAGAGRGRDPAALAHVGLSKALPRPAAARPAQTRALPAARRAATAAPLRTRRC
jgi:hypothetical protein